MRTGTNEDYFLKKDFQKMSVTPNTAEDDFYLTTNEQQYSSTKREEVNFEKVEKIQEKKFEKTTDVKKFSKVLDKIQEQKKGQGCKFQIRIVLEQKKSRQRKELLKRLNDIIEEQNSVKLIFEDQHRKIKLSFSTEYKIIIILVTEEYFERQLCNTKLLIQSIKEKRKQIIIKDVVESIPFQISLQIQKNLDGFAIKFYSFQSQIALIENVYDQKQSLINKSQKLNDIKHLRDLRGIFFILSQQNMGSRIIQKLMNKAQPDELQLLSKELNQHFEFLVTDRYGNYVFQKLIELSSLEERNLILKKITQPFVGLLMSKAGTHTLQKMIEFLDFNGLSMVVTLLQGFQVSLSKNEFGTHFIQKILNLFPCFNMLKSLLNCFTELACDKFGIVVLKSLLPICSQDFYWRCNYYQLCMNSFKDIAYDEYGHYIIEELFNYYSEEQLRCLLQNVVFYINEVSNNSFSSSIIRRGLQIYQNNWSQPIMRKLRSDGMSNLMETKTGSFVLHRILDTSKSFIKNQFVSQMKSLVSEIKNYDRRNKWKKYFNLV